MARESWLNMAVREVRILNSALLLLPLLILMLGNSRDLVKCSEVAHSLDTGGSQEVSVPTNTSTTSATANTTKQPASPSTSVTNSPPTSATNSPSTSATNSPSTSATNSPLTSTTNSRSKSTQPSSRNKINDDKTIKVKETTKFVHSTWNENGNTDNSTSGKLALAVIAIIVICCTFLCCCTILCIRKSGRSRLRNIESDNQPVIDEEGVHLRRRIVTEQTDDTRKRKSSKRKLIMELQQWQHREADEPTEVIYSTLMPRPVSRPSFPSCLRASTPRQQRYRVSNISSVLQAAEQCHSIALEEASAGITVENFNLIEIRRFFTSVEYLDIDYDGHFVQENSTELSATNRRRSLSIDKVNRTFCKRRWSLASLSASETKQIEKMLGDASDAV